jgi:phosphatidyl-myo-inositol dimannoside synthase
MERLNAQLAAELVAEGRVIIIGPRGCGTLANDQTVVYEAPGTSIPLFLAWAMLTSVWLALIHRPVVVVGGSGLVAPIVRMAAWVARAHAVTYLHGLDIIAPSKIYQALWLPAIRRMQACLVNSRHTASLAHAAGVEPKRVTVIAPGVQVRQEVPADAAISFRASFDLGDVPLMLSVGRLTIRKGLSNFVARALPAIVEAYPSAVLVLIGDDAPDAILKGAAGERERIVAIAADLGLSANLRMLGPVAESVLDSAYAACDVHVFPVRDVPGDVEGFGMVAIEAAIHGLPTVAFAVGGVPDAVADGVSGTLVPAGNLDMFGGAVKEVLSVGRKHYESSCRAFAEQFSWERFGIEVRAVLARLEASKS